MLFDADSSHVGDFCIELSIHTIITTNWRLNMTEGYGLDSTTFFDDLVYVLHTFCDLLFTWSFVYISSAVL